MLDKDVINLALRMALDSEQGYLDSVAGTEALGIGSSGGHDSVDGKTYQI
jgi:hypothetical protein